MSPIATKRSLAVLSLGLLFLGLLAAPGCSREPSPVGSGFFRAVPLDSLTVYAASSSNYRNRITGNSSTLLVGRSGQVDAWSLMQFSVPSGFETSAIVRAELRLIPQYWLPDSSGTLAFTVHKILRTWSEFDVTFDSLSGLYEVPARNNFSRQMSPRDTISVQIDTALVLEWMRSGQAHGLLLRPDTTNSTVVYGFGVISPTTGADLRPELIIHYRSDTVIASRKYRTVKEAFVADSPLPPADPQFLYVQAGIADRGIISFNVSAIPRSANIVSALLTFVRNPSLSVRSDVSQDSVHLHYVVDTKNPPTLGLSALAKPAAADSGSEFTADLGRIVQLWITGNPNHGIALRTFGEFSSVDKFVFYGAPADSLFRPRLKIFYSTLP